MGVCGEIVTSAVRTVTNIPTIAQNIVCTDCLQRLRYPKSFRSKLVWFLGVMLLCVSMLVMVCLPSCPEGDCIEMCNIFVRRPVVRTHYNTSRSGPHYPHTKRYLPGCIIIGVRKAGTRAILRYLNIHPDVVTATDEIHFFDVNDEYEKGLDYYRRQMPYTFKHQLTIEKTPSYFTDPFVPERIYRMNSSILLLLIVKDPITRLISDYVQFREKKLRKGDTPLPFEKEVFDNDGNVRSKYGPIQTSSYFIHFARWLEIFPLDQIYVVDGDLLIADPYKEISNVETFLKLDHRITKDNFFYNETKGFFCVNDGNLSTCLGETKGRHHPPVKPDHLRKLSDFFSIRNRMFFKMVNKTFDWM